jgi:hypothetical protein
MDRFFRNLMNPIKLRPRPATIKAVKITVIWKIKQTTLTTSRMTLSTNTTLCVINSLILFIYRSLTVRVKSLYDIILR